MLVVASLLSVTASLLTPTAATATESRTSVAVKSESMAAAAAKKKAKKAAHKKKIKQKKPAKKKQVQMKLRRVIKVANKQKGKPYVYGGTGKWGFDCSGLTQFVYKKAANKKIPRTSRDQRAKSKKVSAKIARVGDLVFFHKQSGVYHVGIYAGKGQVIHAPYSGTVVRKEKIWTKSVTYGRVI